MTSDAPRRFQYGETVVLASHNKGKLRELLPALGQAGVNIISAADLNLPEPAETENTFVGNARIKAHFAAQETGMPAIADDSGMCIEALNGEPGVYTADWTETPEGRDYAMAARKIGEALSEAGAEAPCICNFHTTIVVAWPDGHEEVFEGDVFGRFHLSPQGDGGFGFDPYFVPFGKSLTFAEMPQAEKDAMSHRMQALNKMIRHCLPLPGQSAPTGLPALDAYDSKFNEAREKFLEVMSRDPKNDADLLFQWVIENEINPYGVFADRYMAGYFETLEGAAAAYHLLRHAVLDDGDITYVMTESHGPYAIMAFRHEENFEEMFLESMRQHGHSEFIVKTMGITGYFDTAEEFIAAYQNHEGDHQAAFEKLGLE